MKRPSPSPHVFLWCEKMSHLHNTRVTVGSKLKLYTDFLSYGKSVTCQSEHVRHPVLARWVERWRRQVSANQPMSSYGVCSGDERGVRVANHYRSPETGSLWRTLLMMCCGGFQQHAHTAQRWWPHVQPTLLHTAKININNTRASPRTCTRHYLQLRCVRFSSESAISCSVLLASDWTEFILSKEPSLPTLSQAGC